MLLLTESFPVEVQGTCSGIVESVAQLGIFLGPVVITICINNQIYPIIALSFIQLILIIIPLFALEERKEVI
jgi:MFS family permease